MPISWTTALGMQDDSIEGMLARRDQSQNLRQLAGVQQQAIDKEEFRQQQDMRRQELLENVRLREAQQDATNAYREQQQAERAADNERSQYSSLTSGRKPGDRIGKSALDLIGKFEGGTGDYSVDPNDPLQHIYKAEEAKRILAKAESDERIRAAQEKRAIEDQAMQRKQLELQQKAAERAEKDQARKESDEQRKRDRHTAAMTKLKKDAEAVPPHLRPQFNKLVEDLITESQPAWYDFQSEAMGREQAMQKALEKINKQIPGAIQVPPPTGATVPQETPEQRFQRLMKQGQSQGPV